MFSAQGLFAEVGAGVDDDAMIGGGGVSSTPIELDGGAQAACRARIGGGADLGRSQPSVGTPMEVPVPRNVEQFLPCRLSTFSA